MGWIKTVSVIMLFVGSWAWGLGHPDAALTSGSNLGTVRSWTAHLNRYYPGLRLSVTSDLGQERGIQRALQDLQKLEDNLQGEIQLAPKSLKALACSRPQCDGGGGGGPCKTCFHPEREDNSVD
ncbi:MAG: hypothetical protein AB7F86_15490 [Bdellovibrionales bacterium]